jgi:hypothetical protein
MEWSDIQWKVLDLLCPSCIAPLAITIPTPTATPIVIVIHLEVKVHSGYQPCGQQMVIQMLNLTHCSPARCMGEHPTKHILHFLRLQGGIPPIVDGINIVIVVVIIIIVVIIAVIDVWLNMGGPIPPNPMRASETR